jgi:HEAT repeat protein
MVLLASGCSKSEPTLAGGKPVDYWVKALSGPDPKLRKTAASKLGNVGPADPAAFPALLEALKDPHPGVRREVILALLKFGPKAAEAVPALRELRLHDRDAKVRDFAARAVEKIEKE